MSRRLDQSKVFVKGEQTRGSFRGNPVWTAIPLEPLHFAVVETIVPAFDPSLVLAVVETIEPVPWTDMHLAVVETTVAL